MYARMDVARGLDDACVLVSPVADWYGVDAIALTPCEGCSGPHGEIGLPIREAKKVAYQILAAVDEVERERGDGKLRVGRMRAADGASGEGRA